MTDLVKLHNENESESSVRVLLRRVKRHPAYQLWKTPRNVLTNTLPDISRLATSRFRHLPTTVMIGAPKAGVPQLYWSLVTHPRCYRGKAKEIDYFSEHAERSVAWYRSWFPLSFRVTRKAGHVIDASTSYLQTPAALRKMQQVLPKTRIVVLFHDPVARAFSHFQHRKTLHLESRSFADCVAEEIRANEFPAVRGTAMRGNAAPMLGYVARGYYALQLELLLKLFPRNKVLMIDSASVFKDTAAVCERVFNFMGLESFEIQPIKRFAVAHGEENIHPRVADMLREHYRPYDAILAEMMGCPISWMEQAASKAA